MTNRLREGIGAAVRLALLGAALCLAQASTAKAQFVGGYGGWGYAGYGFGYGYPGYFGYGYGYPGYGGFGFPGAPGYGFGYPG